MDTKFSKTTSTKGTIKGLIIHEGVLVSEETGEQVDLVELLSPIYGSQVFDISTSATDKEEL